MTIPGEHDPSLNGATASAVDVEPGAFDEYRGLTELDKQQALDDIVLAGVTAMNRAQFGEIPGDAVTAQLDTLKRNGKDAQESGVPGGKFYGDVAMAFFQGAMRDPYRQFAGQGDQPFSELLDRSEVSKKIMHELDAMMNQKTSFIANAGEQFGSADAQVMNRGMFGHLDGMMRLAQDESLTKQDARAVMLGTVYAIGATAESQTLMDVNNVLDRGVVPLMQRLAA